jgi:Spy/CpxP family protein refolding chaperone
MRKFIIAVLAISAVGLAGFTGGCGRGHRGLHDPANIEKAISERVDDALDDLNATDAQRSHINELKAALVKDAIALMEGNRASRKEALAELESEKPDAAKLHGLLDTRADAMRAVAHKAVDAVLKVHQILTPEQRAQVAKKVQRCTGNR